MKTLITHIKELVTFAGVAQKAGHHPQEKDLGILRNASLLIEDGKIVWIGKKGNQKKVQTFDAEQSVVLPGLIDPHTHLVFAGSRHEEFLWRSEGKDYLEIAQKGGGILSTVRSVQKTSSKELLQLARARLKTARSFGVTTLEIKSGYGLSLKDELKILRVIKQLGQDKTVKIVPTFLGAHAIPQAFTNKNDYVDLICKTMIPEVSKHKLAEFCDVFIEEGFFDLEQTKQILKAAQNNHLKIRIHADEFKALGGTELAVSQGANSVDHLISITDSGIKALSQSDTVATLLPGTSLFLKKPFAPARKLIDEGSVVALGTDFNPGTCMTQNLALIATLGITQMKMTVAEALSAITYNAAKSLGKEASIGSIEVGKEADLSFFKIPSYSYLPYHFGQSLCWKTMLRGKLT